MPVPEEGSAESSLYDSEPTYSPFDPEVVHPTSPGPAPSSSPAAPGFGDTSGADDESPAEAPQDQPALPQFDPKHRDTFTGLLYLGALTKTFTRWGHEFVVRTLTTEEQAEIALLVKPYEGTRSANAVYQSGVVAAGVITVDGRPLPGSIVQGDSGLTSVKYPYVMSKWYPPIREGIFNEIFALEVLVRQALDAMGEASG